MTEQSVRSDELADIIEIGVLRVTTDLRVVSWNRWLESASGLSAEAAAGKQLKELFPDLGSAAEEAFAKAVGGATVVMSHRFHGRLLPLPAPAGYESFAFMQQSARLVPTVGADGAVTGALVLITDVTERVAREAELNTAVQKAEAANKAKSDFLTAMSHELRTPIGAMWSYADLLRQEMFGPILPAQRDHLGRIKSVGDHLLRIVEEILTFARIEAGREALHNERVNLVEVAREAVTAVESIAVVKGLAVAVDLPAGPLYATTDVVKLRQILINLLGNAVKFTTHGTIGVRVIDHQSGFVSFQVHDTGRGIPQEQLARIFEPFTQLGTSHARPDPGTGLGLTVSQRLARLLGGDVTVQSQQGVGSTFELSIPIDCTVERDAEADVSVGYGANAEVS
ncbi:MAG: sensor histidine kinase [Gemmatimonadaceae bacterium]